MHSEFHARHLPAHAVVLATVASGRGSKAVCRDFAEKRGCFFRYENISKGQVAIGQGVGVASVRHVTRALL